MNDCLHPVLAETGDAGWVTAQHPAVSRLLDPKECSNRALLLSGAYRDRMHHLTVLLDAALRAVVQRYFADPRIRAVYALPPELERILRLAAPRAYRVGWYRPDLIFDRDGTARICEIGARYPLNGWMVSRALSQSGVDFWDDLCALYPPGTTLALVHQNEASGEIDCLSDHLQREGVSFVSLPPQQLELRDGRLHALGRTPDRLILQLDRSELLAFAPEVLAHLVERGDYFNDVRTLILVHDKRVLAVLSDPAIMRDTIAWDLYEQLQPHVIPSICANSAVEAERLLLQDGDWIAKPSSGGRGIGSLVRSRCSVDEWADLVRQHWSHLMFQPYLEQLDYMDGEPPRPIHMVGMILCRDAMCYGFGVFRGSDDAVINLHQRRGKLYPCRDIP